MDSSSVLAQFKGRTGILRLYGDRVETTREGLVSMLSKTIAGTRTYFYKDLNNVEYSKPSVPGGNGWIKFIVPGTLDYHGGHMLGQPMPIDDPNSFVFGSMTKHKEICKEAEKIYNLLLSKISEAKNISGAANVAQQTSGADELAKFKKLLDDGVIAQDEFDVKKKQLLGL